MNHIMKFGMIKYEGMREQFDFIIVGFSLVIFIALPVAFSLRKPFGLAMAPIIGQFIAGGLTLLMAVCWMEDSPVGYLACFFGNAIFTIVGGVLASQTIVELVPSSQKDKWLGYQGGVQAGSMALAPFVLVRILDDEDFGPFALMPGGCDMAGTPATMPNSTVPMIPLCYEVDGTFPQGSFLFANAAFCFLSCIPYLMLLRKLPKPSKLEAQAKENQDKEDAIALKTFEETGDFTWLTGEKLYEVQMKRVKANETPLQQKFGSFAPDKDHLARMQKMGRNDFEFFSRKTRESIFRWENGSEGERNELRGRIEQSQASHMWTPEGKKEVGEWFTDYLEHAGYGNPLGNPRVWKTMMMLHFPMIMEGGVKNPEYAKNPVKVWRMSDRLIRIWLRLDEEQQKASLTTVSSLNIAMLRAPGTG